MKTSTKLYESVKGIWNSYYEHPFVRGIGDGTLSIEKFKFYMIQDYLFLLDYARIYSLGIVKSRDEHIMRGFSKMVEGILNGEMNIHKLYMKRLGITETDIRMSKPSLSNCSYTAYMLSVSETGDLSELSTSLLACMWSYLLIGKKLSNIEGAVENEFYGEWIRGYISPEYENDTNWIIRLVDDLTDGIGEKKFKRLEEIFVNTSKYEYMFWDMAYKGEM